MKNSDHSNNKKEVDKDLLCEKHVKPLQNIVRNCSKILSDSCRQLALGIGSVVLIRSIDTTLTTNYKLILSLLAFFFFIDGVQYWYQKSQHQNLSQRYIDDIKSYRRKNHSDFQDEDIDHKKISNKVDIIFKLKIVLLIIASLIFLCSIWH